MCRRGKQISIMKNYLSIFFVIALFLVYSQEVSAHSTVSPSQVPDSKYETFTLSVPTERDVPTIGVRLLIPEGLERVTPFVKAGWSIEVKKAQNGEEPKVTEIIWTNGAIPAGQKDVFEFTARTPQEAATLIWKAYQTYEGGEVVAWDRDPKQPNEDEVDGKVKNPYSVTEVIADVPVTVEKSIQQSGLAAVAETKGSFNNTSLVSFLALILSVIALGISLKKKSA